MKTAWTIFREDSKEDGTPGPVSIRRVLAFVLILAAIGLFVGGFFISKESWYVFIPGITSLAGALLLLFFTTWSDVAEVAKAVKK